MKTSASLAAFLGTLLLATSASADQFYKWTDEQGVTHYSADPPPKSVGNAAEVKVRTRLPEDTDAAVEALKKNRDAASKAVKEKDKKDAKDGKAATDSKPGPERYAERCKQLKSDLQTLEDYRRIRVSDSKGENRVLSDDEKQQQMDETQRQIKAFCEG